ncbi:MULTISPECIES: MATE family efflux transporter [unclassified Fusibacter]|uniref:MATE family efflux transporter n=1 Tax=unclassified Fusibacter TaxID=2624464 RepID=UPI0010108C5E|nr:MULTISPECIES: MATE family efflux transporter [unclassified Fusibacter]MCK8058724.1 MATE family efflux transporter [Fusibacter sp. A2]NPE21798.1 MATE family efflux transporter [Fusibacter sp. A1]RXV61370.1 MATE family efflux transporter [Fusibacter sp. A1]
MKLMYRSDALSKRIHAIAIPMLFNYIAHVLYSISDQAIIGRTSLAEYAAVSVIANLLYAITGTLGIISVVLTILGARKIGQGNDESYERLFNSILTVVAALGVIFEVLCIIGGRVILKLLFGMHGPMLDYGYLYLVIAGLGLGINLAIFVFSSYFKSIEKTKVLFYGTLLSCGINLLIDYLLVFGKLGLPRLGVMGAAIGTVVGLLVNLFIFGYAFGKYSSFKLRVSVHPVELKEIIQSFLPLLGQDFAESAGFSVIVMMMIARLGEVAIASYGVLIVLLQVLTLPVYAYSTALISIASNAIGAQDYDLVGILAKKVLKNLFLVLLPVASLVYLFRNHIGKLITDSGVVVNTVAQVVAVVIIVQFLNAGNQIYRSLLNAVQDEKWLMNFSFAMSIFTLLSIYIACIALRFGLIGLYVALGLSYAISHVWCRSRYRKIEKSYGETSQNTIQLNSV